MKNTAILGFAAALLLSVPAFADNMPDNTPSSTEHKAAPHGSKAELAMNAREAKTTQELNQQESQAAAPDASASASASMTPAPSSAISTDNSAPAPAGANMSSGASQPAQ
jgi:hypothetical protein